MELVISKCNGSNWLERLSASLTAAKVMGSVPASSDPVESVGVADEAVLNIVHQIRPNCLFTERNYLNNCNYFLL